jgi:integral membrane sensor domain MASE1
METFLAILMVLGIFVVLPIIIAFIVIGVYTGLFRVIGVQAKRRGEVRAVVKGLQIIGNCGVQLTILILLCLYYPLIYYFGEIIDHFGWESLRWDFFYTVHDIHRVVFLIPILFAAYCFRIKGAIITAVFAFAVFLPRSLLLSPYPDPTSRMVVFAIFALALGIFVGILMNKIERLQRLVDSSKS